MSSQQSQVVSLRNVLVLTALSVVFLSGTIVSGFALIPPVHFGSSFAGGRVDPPGPVRLLALVAAPAAYVWFCLHLSGRQVGRWQSMRHALGLQLQAAIEAASAAASVIVAVLFIYLVAGFVGDIDTQQSMRDWVAQGWPGLFGFMFVLALPAITMVMTALRLHSLSRKPGALAAAANGTLYRKAIVVRGDAEDTRRELMRYLERLTNAEMPGLGRVMYGSHPRLASRDTAEGVVHELVWWSCPMKLLVSCHALDDGREQVEVRCVLRGGIYRLYLVPTPADAVAQMQYIESHLLQPLAAQLDKIAAERQRDALRDHAVATQLRILQAQIEPHFLFNTLANVRQLYRSSLASGELMMGHLIAYLRCAMDELRAEQSSIAKEMDVALHYLSIMKIRMGDRLSFQFLVPESLMPHPFPPAMLISLIENAIKHGLADCERGEITMSASCDGNTLRVIVADNGAGFSSIGGTGVGLSNIRQRLEAMYGTRGWLEVGAPAEGGFSAAIVIPFEERNH